MHVAALSCFHSIEMQQQSKLLIAAAVGTTVVVVGYLLLRKKSAPVEDLADIDDDEASASVPALGTATSSVASGGVAASTKPEDTSAAPDATAPTAPSSAEEARRAKERGNKRFAGRQYENAIAEYTRAIELADPTDPEVAKYYGNRAQCYACLEKFAEAENDCDASLRVDALYVKALARRATAREKLGKLEGAISDFTGALLLSNMNHQAAAEAIDRLVKTVAAQKTEARLQEPMRCLPSSSFIATFVDSFKDHRVLVETASGDTEAVTKSIKKAASGSATQAQKLCERACVRMKARQYEQALSDWGAAACAISPLGDAFADGLGGGSGPTAASRAAALSEWNAACAAADAKLPPSQRASPSLCLSMVGMFLHLRGNYDEAMRCYDYALELEPKAIDVLLKRASLWFEKEQLAKAFEDFDTAFKVDPEHADVYCHRGQLHMLQQDLDKAVSDLKKSVALDGESILARIQLGMAHHRLKQNAEARAVFQEAEKAFPNSPDALNYHGEFMVENGDLDGARKKFQKAIRVSGGVFALGHVNLGVLKLHGDQDLHGAIEACKQAINADPLCETAHVHMAHLQLQNADLRAAVSAFDDAVALLRVKQELEETFAMREAAAAQLSLLNANPEVYGPAMAKQREAAAMAMAQQQQQQ